MGVYDCKSLEQLDMGALMQLVTGYVSSAKYEIQKTEALGQTTITMRRVSLERSCVKRYVHLDAETLARYARILRDDLSWGAYEADHLLGGSIMKPYSSDLRERAIAAVEAGEETQAEVAARFSISKSTLAKWWYRWQATDSCAALPYAGGPKRRLSPYQLESLRALLLEGAMTHGWENDLWTAKRVAEIVRKKFEIECSSRHAWTILRQYLGWTSQRPIQKSKERDEAEIQKWKKKDFPRILRDAHRKGAYLVFIDESGFLLAPIIRRTFAPRGETPTIKVADPHGRISVAGAITVSPIQKRLGFFYHLLPDNANFHGDSIARFLSEICHRISSPITVLWDGFSIHSSKPVNEYLKKHHRIAFEEFPAHAPELNPVDKIWFYTKYDRLSNYAPTTSDALRIRLIQEFLALQSKPNVLAWCIKETGLNIEL